MFFYKNKLKLSPTTIRLCISLFFFFAILSTGFLVWKNATDYPLYEPSMPVGVARYFISSLVFLVFPGLLSVFLFLNKIPSRILKLSLIPGLSISYWILLSLFFYTLTGTFSFSTYLVGALGLIATAIVAYIKYKNQLFEIKLSQNEFLAITLVIVASLISLFTFGKALYPYEYIPNYDAQTHSQIVASTVDEKTLDIQKIYANKLTPLKDQSFYPIAFHIIASLFALATGDFIPEVLRNTVIIIGAMVPVFSYAFFRSLTRRNFFAIITAFASIMFFWFPFKPLTWGGAPQFFGIVLSLPLTGLIYLLLRKYQFSNLISNLTITLIFALLAISHPSVAITSLMLIVIISWPYIIKGFKKLNFKTIMLSLGIGLIALALLFFRDLNSLIELYSTQVIEKDEVIKEVAMSFHPSLALRAVFTDFNYWFSFESPVFFILFLIGGIYVLYKNNRLGIRLGVFATLIVFFSITVLSTKSIPILQQLGNVWFQSIQRVMYFFYIPVIFFVAVPVHKALFEAGNYLRKTKLSVLALVTLALVLIGPLYFANLSAVLATLESEFSNHTPTQEEFEDYKFFRTLEPGTVIGFPRLMFMHEKNLNWVNSISLDTPILIDRGVYHTAELEVRRKIAADIEFGKVDLCNREKNSIVKEFNIRYIYLNINPYHLDDSRRNIKVSQEEYVDFVNRFSQEECTEIIYQTDSTTIFKLN